MVVSGLPDCNGDRHAGQVTSFAIHLLSGVNSFVIPHLTDTKLRVRIGIHSGSLSINVGCVYMYCCNLNKISLYMIV